MSEDNIGKVKISLQLGNNHNQTLKEGQKAELHNDLSRTAISGRSYPTFSQHHSPHWRWVYLHELTCEEGINDECGVVVDWAYHIPTVRAKGSK